MIQTRQGDLLADAYQEEWDRGASWQEGLAAGIALMPGNGKEALAGALGVEVNTLGKG